MDRAARQLNWQVLLLAWLPCVTAGQVPDTLYRLPYLEGSAHTISQAPGGFMTTHTTRESRHAIDFRMPEGTPVAAARGGVVIEAEWRHVAGARRGALRAAGNLVRIRHADGSMGTYAHLMHVGVSVEPGEELQAGRIVGYSGSTGYSSAPHLHFAVTRLERAGAALQEVSVPVKFTNGDPPVAFAPRVGISVTARFASPAEPLALPAVPARAPAPAVPPPPEVLVQGWIRLAAMLVTGIAGLWWFYRFSRS